MGSVLNEFEEDKKMANNMSEAREEQFRALRKLDKIPFDVEYMPDYLHDFLVHSDNYTVDDEGYIYDPYYQEYPTIDQIQEQYDYQRGEE